MFKIDIKSIHLVLIPALLISISGCEKKEEVTQEMPPLEVPVSKPIVKNITEWDEYIGRFQATDRVEVRARVSGYIDQVNFEDGQMVKKGDVLFIIDPRPFKLELDVAMAQLKHCCCGNQLP